MNHLPPDPLPEGKGFRVRLKTELPLTMILSRSQKFTIRRVDSDFEKSNGNLPPGPLPEGKGN